MKKLLKRGFHFVAETVVFVPALLGRMCSNAIFVFWGQCLALVPGKIGSFLRIAYYSMTLEECERDSFIGFGSYFSHREASVGHGVYIGAYCIIGKARLRDHVTIGSQVSILSGTGQHGFSEVGKPIQQQEGTYRKVVVGDNCWIGNGAIVMVNLGVQNVIGAGSVVAKPTGDYEMLVGNPAKCIKKIVDDPS